MSIEFIKDLADNITSRGIYAKLKNGELETRCPFCGDSVRSKHKGHLYIEIEEPHRCFCQRCNFGSGYLSIEILEALKANTSEFNVYIRKVNKAIRTKAIRTVKNKTFRLKNEYLKIPLLDRTEPYDLANIEYLERRLGGVLTDEEVERYKIITCGLYGFLDVNGIDSLTVKQREADRLNDTCVGFLSLDESTIIFRSIDEDYVKRGGMRYTNYRIYNNTEVNKAFGVRNKIDLTAPKHTVVASEGIIDLIQIERQFFNAERWLPNHIGLATNGSSHANVLNRLPAIGIISIDLQMYIDNQAGMEEQARKIPNINPFFKTSEFSMSIWKNTFYEVINNEHIAYKDFGVPPDKIKRVKCRS